MTARRTATATGILPPSMVGGPSSSTSTTTTTTTAAAAAVTAIAVGPDVATTILNQVWDRIASQIWRIKSVWSVYMHKLPPSMARVLFPVYVFLVVTLTWTTILTALTLDFLLRWAAFPVLLWAVWKMSHLLPPLFVDVVIFRLIESVLSLVFGLVKSVCSLFRSVSRVVLDLVLVLVRPLTSAPNGKSKLGPKKTKPDLPDRFAVPTIINFRTNVGDQNPVDRFPLDHRRQQGNQENQNQNPQDTNEEQEEDEAPDPAFNTLWQGDNTLVVPTFDDRGRERRGPVPLRFYALPRDSDSEWSSQSESEEEDDSVGSPSLNPRPRPLQNQNQNQNQGQQQQQQGNRPNPFGRLGLGLVRPNPFDLFTTLGDDQSEHEHENESEWESESENENENEPETAPPLQQQQQQQQQQQRWYTYITPWNGSGSDESDETDETEESQSSIETTPELVGSEVSSVDS